MTTRLYPTTSIEVLDGNLIDRVSVPETAVLIIERAAKGPVDTLYYVSDTKTASTVFGSNSPLIKAMGQVLAGGAKDVVLYRVGGRSASIDNLFGLNTGISTIEASSIASRGYSVYIGPEPLNPSLDCLMIFDINGRIVYSDALDGEVDLNLFVIDGFTKTDNKVYVGSHLNPVPMSQVITEAGKRIVKVDSTGTVTIDQADIDNMSKNSLIVKLNDTYLKAEDYELSGTTLTVKADLLAANPTNSVEVAYVVKYTEDERKTLELAYKEGEDLLNATWKERYEAFDRALENIPRITTTSVYIGDVFNPPNIADKSEEKDRLEYILINENEDGELEYEWSTSKFLYQGRDGAPDTTNINEAALTPNGRPVVLKQYSEVDFVHRAGMWALLTTNEGKYPNIVVGALGPRALTPKYINLWVGKSPVYSSNNRISNNGTGLLGHRLMIGTNKFEGGYFATDTGFPDGNVVNDSNGVRVDLGKYLSIVPDQIVSGGEVISAAGAYAGLISTITPGNSTTNKRINVLLAYELKDSRLKELQAVGYTLIHTKLNKGATVLAGNLASRLTSDFRYISTSLALNKVAFDIEEICDPYIGMGIDGYTNATLQNSLNVRLSERQKQGYFTSFAMTLYQTGPNTLQVNYSIVPKEELRVINNTIKLSRT